MPGIRDNLFGSLAIQGHFVLPEQVDEALVVQQQAETDGKPLPRLGEILVQMGHMTAEQVQAVLQGQTGTSHSRFGEIVVRWRLCPDADVQAALTYQAECRDRGQPTPRLGEVLVTRKLLRPHQIRAVLQAQGKQIAQCPNCHTRYNVVNLVPGAAVQCARCQTSFVPVRESPAKPEPPEAIHSDITVKETAVDNAEAPPAPPGGPQTFGSYQILAKLGADHSGVLYKALDTAANRTVALRLFSRQVMQGPEDFERWVAAGQAAAELDHPNLQRILFMGSDHGRAFLVLEFIEGQSLRQRLQERGQLPVLEALEILIPVAEALAYGHANELIHGDLHPRHVLLGSDRRVRLAGLGTPKKVMQDLRLMASFSGALPLYAAPEVLINEEDADERSDLYSLGAIGYHLITGRPPLEGASLLQAGFLAASKDIPPAHLLDPLLPPYLGRLLAKAMSPEPEDRYDSAATLQADLRKCRAGAMVQATDVPDIAPPTRPRTSRHHPVRARTGKRTYQVHKPLRRSDGVRTSGAGRTGSGARPAVPGTRSVPAVTLGRGSSGIGRAVPGTGAAPAVAPGRVGSGAVPGAGARPPESIGTGPLARVGSGIRAGVPGTGTAARLAAVRGSPSGARTAAMRMGGRHSVRRAFDSARTRFTDFSLRAKLGIIFGLLVVVTGGLYALQASRPRQDVDTDTGPLRDVRIQPAAPEERPVDRQARNDLALIADHEKKNKDDHSGIVRRLDEFLAAYGGLTPSPASVDQARKLRADHAQAGVAAGLEPLREKVRALTEQDKFRAATDQVQLWRNLWGPAAAGSAADEQLKWVEERRKTQAEELLARAAQLRSDKDWSGARAIYRRIADNYPAEATARALAEASSVDEAERTAKAGAATEAEKARQQRNAAEREANAPARYDRIVKNLQGPLARLDLRAVNTLFETEGPEFAGTTVGPRFQALKSDIERIHKLAQRIETAGHEGRLKSLYVKYREEPCPVVDARPDGPVLDAKGGRIEVKWGDLELADLLEAAGRATDATAPSELLDLAVCRLYLGQWAEADLALKNAAKVGADVRSYAALLAARRPAAPPEEKPAPKTPDATGPAAPAGQDPVSATALKALGFEISHGFWKVSTEQVLSAVPSGGDYATVMSLKRSLGRFKNLCVELRGEGDSAGFSFGSAIRFLIKPTGEWQRLILEVAEGDRLRMRVGDEIRPSLQDPKGAGADNLPDAFFLRAMGKRIEFRNFEVDSKSVKPLAVKEKPPEPSGPVQNAAAVEALKLLGWEIAGGTWDIVEGGMVGQPAEGQREMGLRRAFKPCAALTVEIRGSGESAGFSFGKGKRFIAAPGAAWKTLVLQVNVNGRPQLLLDGKPAASLEDTAAVTSADLGEMVGLRAVGTKVEFRGFKIE